MFFVLLGILTAVGFVESNEKIYGKQTDRLMCGVSQEYSKLA